MTLPASSIEAVRRTLLDDVAECWFALKQSDEQVNRRNYVRTVFALVEGWVSVLKAFVIEEVSAGRFIVTEAERAMLAEETYDVDDSGKTRSRRPFIPVRNNLRFTFDIFARSHGVIEGPDYQGSGWQEFQKALQARNRVTHPKVTTDLDIADDEVAATDAAWSWFLDASFVLYVEGRANVLAKLKAVGKMP